MSQSITSPHDPAVSSSLAMCGSFLPAASPCPLSIHFHQKWIVQNWSTPEMEYSGLSSSKSDPTLCCLDHCMDFKDALVCWHCHWSLCNLAPNHPPLQPHPIPLPAFLSLTAPYSRNIKTSPSLKLFFMVLSFEGPFCPSLFPHFFLLCFAPCPLESQLPRLKASFFGGLDGGLFPSNLFPTQLGPLRHLCFFCTACVTAVTGTLGLFL